MNSKIKKISSAKRLLDCVNDSWKAQALYVAAELKIADYLSNGPKTSSKLAKLTQTHAPSLHRLLRALSTLEICKELKDGSFEMSPTGLLLKKEAPDSLRSWILWSGGHLWNVWGNLLHSIKTGESARKWLTGKEDFEHLEGNPEAAEIFSQAMAELTRLECKNILNEYDFSKFRIVADIGGGQGELLIHILEKNQKVSGILFDLPQIIDQAKSRWQKNLKSRCQFIPGNFSQSVPSGADAYVLKNVLHDWDDEKSKIILQNCRKAMPKEGRLLLIERVLPEHFSSEHREAARSDLIMLAALAGRERTKTEFQNLLNSSGFFVKKIFPTRDASSVIEAIIAG